MKHVLILIVAVGIYFAGFWQGMDAQKKKHPLRNVAEVVGISPCEYTEPAGAMFRLRYGSFGGTFQMGEAQERPAIGAGVVTVEVSRDGGTIWQDAVCRVRLISEHVPRDR